MSRIDTQGTNVLSKTFEAKNIVVGDSKSRSYIIPEGESWNIASFGASGLIKGEVEFMFSPDGGVTWINPYDGNEDVLICIMISIYTPSVSIPLENPLVLQGDGENTILKIKCVNRNSETATEIVGWINGWIDSV